MFYDIAQNTDEWLDMRAGKITGSAISKVMAHHDEMYSRGPKKGQPKGFGEPAKRYAVDIAVERVTGKRIVGERYMNVHMEAGHVEEPIARKLYCDSMFTDVANGGFFDNQNTGCSPDGLVGKVGMVEIKSVVPATHYACMAKNSFDTSYKWQIAFNLRETKREWLDYISYCEVFPENNRLFVVRVTAEDMEEQFDMIDVRLAEFELLIKEISARIK